MEKVLFNELKVVSAEIMQGSSETKAVELVFAAIRKMIEVSEMAEEVGINNVIASVQFDENDFSQEILREMIAMAWEGLNKSLVMEYGLNVYASMQLHGYEALVYLIYIRGMGLMMEGVRSFDIQTLLESMCMGILYRQTNGKVFNKIVFVKNEEN